MGKKIEKNLANCTPREFLAQTAKIRKTIANWAELTGIVDLYTKKPQYSIVPINATNKQRAAAIHENAKREQRQVMENIGKCIEAVAEKYPDETLAVLACCFFMEPDDLDNYSMADIMQGFTDMLSHEAVIGFFTSLATLGRKNTSAPAKA